MINLTESITFSIDFKISFVPKSSKAFMMSFMSLLSVLWDRENSKMPFNCLSIKFEIFLNSLKKVIIRKFKKTNILTQWQTNIDEAVGQINENHETFSQSIFCFIEIRVNASFKRLLFFCFRFSI